MDLDFMALDPDSKKWLESRFDGRVKFDEPMSRHTSFRVGGPAEAYVTPECPEELIELINWVREQDLPYLVLGDGTNILVKDAGIPGIVIVLAKCLNKISQTGIGSDGVIVTAMAGAKMNSLCSFAITHGFGGMNFAIGIPGTVGGAIMMNAGTAFGGMEKVLDSIKILLPNGLTRRIKRENLNFEYRKLSWDKEKNEVYQGQPLIIEGCFCLHPSDSQKLKKEAEEILKTRKKRQPTHLPSAGCFFKNPASGKTAGQLIELAGLKGKKIGGAKISSTHANFIVNRNKASAADILALMELVQETTSKMFNIDLETEVKIVGA